MKLLAGIALAVALCAARAQAQELRGRTLEEWRQALEPAPEELAWAEIPWRASFWEALVEARASERPVLLWAMNGHPLGCV